MPDDSTTFFYYRSPHNHNLHSFPTRRSSDLSMVGRTMINSASHRARTSRGNSGYCLRRPDRKSTRLNSSHVSISYAVFCLKKKSFHSARRLAANAETHVTDPLMAFQVRQNAQ